MIAHRDGTDAELRGNLLRASPLREQPQYRSFSRGEIVFRSDGPAFLVRPLRRATLEGATEELLRGCFQTLSGADVAHQVNDQRGRAFPDGRDEDGHIQPLAFAPGGRRVKIEGGNLLPPACPLKNPAAPAADLLPVVLDTGEHVPAILAKGLLF